jgi:uncharacterized protein YjbI with pentapeptide repeats
MKAGMRRIQVGAVSAACVAASMLVLGTSPAHAAASCPTVDPVTHAVTPAPAPHVDWDGCDLSAANMDGADLAGANLSGAVLRNVSATNANLALVNLTSADLTGATLTNTSLLSADLANANLTSATMESVDLTTSTATGATMTGVDLTGATLAGVLSGGIVGTPASLPANWSMVNNYLVGPDANLTGADLAGVSLSGDDLDNATLSNADLHSSDLTSANLNANLTSANLTGAKLGGADLLGATLTGVQSGAISGTPTALPYQWVLVNGYLAGPNADLTGADLHGADLRGATLTYAAMSGANLAGADLHGVSMYYVTLTNASLTAADLSNADLGGGHLTGAAFSGANLSDASLTFARLGNADLTNATLIGADLSYADLTDVNFTDANLTGANLLSVVSSGVVWSGATCPDGSSSDVHVDGCLSGLDTTAPTAAPVVTSGQAGLAGWYTSDVSVAWNWSDDGAVNPASCTTSSSTAAEGNPVTLTASCTDKAGNTAQASFNVKIDKTPPAVAVTGVRQGGVYVLGKVPRVGCATADALSGVAARAVPAVTGGSHGVGQLTATCRGAADIAGNRQAGPVSVKYSVIGGFGGFLAPRPGSVLPKSAHTTTVKFRLATASGKPVPPAQAAALAKAGSVKVTLAGPSIKPLAVTCQWNSAGTYFQCAIPTPARVKTGKANRYTLTAQETTVTGTIPVPAVGKGASTETITFS